jgi:hypothetical protein
MEKLINDFKINFTKGDTYAIAVKFKNIAEDLRTAYFTVKESPDDEPLIQKSLGAGISKIDDRKYKNEKTYKVQLQAIDSANLEAGLQYLYDLQVSLDNVVKTVLSGVFVVNHSVTGVTSTTTTNLEVVVDDEVETEILTTPATNGIEYEQDPVACAKIGDLTALSTSTKENLVQAINEVKNGNLTTDEAVQKVLDGTTYVPCANWSRKADNAVNAKEAEYAYEADEAENAEMVNGIKIEDFGLSTRMTMKKTVYIDEFLASSGGVYMYRIDAYNTTVSLFGDIGELIVGFAGDEATISKDGNGNLVFTTEQQLSVPNLLEVTVELSAGETAEHAKTADNAKIANYADENESKGTIEQRLQRLVEMFISVGGVTQFTISMGYYCPAGTRDEQMTSSMDKPDISDVKPYGANEDWKLVNATVKTGGAGVTIQGDDTIFFGTGNGSSISGIVELTYKYKYA